MGRSWVWAWATRLQMTLFTNPNFIDHIVKSQGAQSLIDQDNFAALQAFIELETRLLLETALKFMRKDRRDQLGVDHVEEAARESGHGDLTIYYQRGKFRSLPQNQLILREDKVYASPEDLFKEEIRLLGCAVMEPPKLRGQWVLIKGKIPSTGDNANFKSLSQLTSLREHEEEQQRKLFNIIRDESYQVLTSEQVAYFRRVSAAISADAGPGSVTVEGDLSRLLPFFLAFIEKELNETAMGFLLKVLENRYLGSTLEYQLGKVLNIMMAYKGPQAYAVGCKLAQLVELYSRKYPVLLSIFRDYPDRSYSTILKLVAFELKLGVVFKLEASLLTRCAKEALANDTMAVLCMRALLTHSGQLATLQQLVRQSQRTLFWHPCPQLTEDPYLALF